MSYISELCGKFIPGVDVFNADYGLVIIDRKQITKYSLRTGNSSLPWRLATGRFYTPEEWQQRRREILAKKLPGLPETIPEKFVYSIKRFLGQY